MGTITVEEPKSVVETVEKYECDSCGSVEDSASDMYTVFVHEGNVEPEDVATVSGHNFMGAQKVSHTEPERTRLLCEHCSAEPSNTQLEQSAATSSTTISAFIVFSTASLGLFVYHLLSLTPEILRLTPLANGMTNIMIVIILSFVFIALVSLLSFISVRHIVDALLQTSPFSSMDITVEKKQE